MKNHWIKIVSALLMTWYCVSIIGFGIHTCSGSGRSYVAVFLTELSCEDIHPEHDCGHSHCCSSGIGKASCCTNDFHVLSLTGTVGHEDGFNPHTYAQDHLICLNTDLEMSGCGFMQTARRHIFKIPDSGTPVHSDVQSLLNIWRI